MPSTAFKLKANVANDFTLGLDAPVKRDTGYRNATNVTKRSITYPSGKTDFWYEVTTDPNLQKQLADRYGGMTDPEMVGVLAAMVQDIEQNLSTDVDRDWESFISKADLLSERFNERFGEGQDPIALARTMGLSNVSISHRPPSENGSYELESPETPNLTRGGRTMKRTKRGSKGMTAYARRSVRSCAVILEERYGLDCLSLATCTLPTSDTSELERICRAFSEIIRVFKQKLERRLERYGLLGDVVLVVEIQEKRYRSWGLVCPHLHLVFPGRRSKIDPWVITPSELREMWESVLENVLNRPVDGSASTRIEAPRKSLKRELGKYLTKGGTLLRDIVKAGKGDLLPSAWWGGTAMVKKEERDRRVTLTGDVPRLLWRNLEAYRKAGLIWYHLVMREFVCPTSGVKREVCMGVVGRFSHDWVLPALMEGKDPLEIAAMQYQGGSVSVTPQKVA
jgi:hypothetical protein